MLGDDWPFYCLKILLDSVASAARVPEPRRAGAGTRARGPKDA
jgi:hypothetical protein